MKLIELKHILERTGLPVAYNCFQTEQQLPFICYMETGTNNFGADNKVYSVIRDITIELYTKTKDIITEMNLEDTLDDYEIFWNKEETWLDDEKCYMIIYQIEI